MLKLSFKFKIGLECMFGFDETPYDRTCEMFAVTSNDNNNPSVNIGFDSEVY